MSEKSSIPSDQSRPLSRLSKERQQKVAWHHLEQLGWQSQEKPENLSSSQLAFALKFYDAQQGKYGRINSEGKDLAKEWVSYLKEANNYSHARVIQQVSQLLETVKQHYLNRPRKKIEAENTAAPRYSDLVEIPEYVAFERICQSAIAQARFQAAQLVDKNTIGLTHAQRVQREIEADHRELLAEEDSPKTEDAEATEKSSYGLTLTEWAQAARELRTFRRDEPMRKSYARAIFFETQPVEFPSSPEERRQQDQAHQVAYYASSMLLDTLYKPPLTGIELKLWKEAEELLAQLVEERVSEFTLMRMVVSQTLKKALEADSNHKDNHSDETATDETAVELPVLAAAASEGEIEKQPSRLQRLVQKTKNFFFPQNEKSKVRWRKATFRVGLATLTVAMGADLILDYFRGDTADTANQPTAVTYNPELSNLSELELKQRALDALAEQQIAAMQEVPAAGTATQMPEEPTGTATAEATNSPGAVNISFAETESQANDSDQEVVSVDMESSLYKFLFGEYFEDFQEARDARVAAMTPEEQAAFFERIGGEEQLHTEWVSIYVLGLDTGDYADRVSQYGNEGRSDQNQVISFNPSTGEMILVTVNRNIQSPELFGDPVNTQTWYEQDEAGNLVLRDAEVARTIAENIIGQPIDAVVEFNFDAVIGFVDAAFPEGLEITIPEDQAFYSGSFEIDFPPGENTLNGEQVLSFLRARKDSVPFQEGSGAGNTDFSREVRFKLVLKAMVSNLIKEIVSHPTKIADTIAEIQARLTTATRDLSSPEVADLRTLWDLDYPQHVVVDTVNDKQVIVRIETSLAQMLDAVFRSLQEKLTLQNIPLFLNLVGEVDFDSMITQLSLSTEDGGLIAGSGGKLILAGTEGTSMTPEAALDYWSWFREQVAKAQGRTIAPQPAAPAQEAPSEETSTEHEGMSKEVSTDQPRETAPTSASEFRLVPPTSEQRYLPAEVPVMSMPGNRSPEQLRAAVQFLDITQNPRYAAKLFETYCNIFAWDVSRMLGLEVPHWIDGTEQSANMLYEWFHNPNGGGENGAGFVQIDASRAQELANQGIPVFGLSLNPGSNGHIALVYPTGESASSFDQLTFASVGRTNGVFVGGAAFSTGSADLFVHSSDLPEQ